MTEGSRYRLPKGFAVTNGSLAGAALPYDSITGHVDSDVEPGKPDGHSQAATQMSERVEPIKQSFGVELLAL